MFMARFFVGMMLGLGAVFVLSLALVATIDANKPTPRATHVYMGAGK